VGPDAPLSPELVFGLDTKLFSLVDGERRDWEHENGKEGWHGDEVETRTVWTGKPPRSANSGKGKGKAVAGHIHEDGKECGDCKTDTNTAKAEHHDTKEVEQKQDAEAVTLVVPIGRETLEQQLSKLSFEIYRVKGLVRLLHPNDRGWTTYILNYAFGRHELHRAEELDGDEEMRGVGVRLTIMGERGEVGRRAKRFAEGLGIGAQCV
jgi:G3E family GTPase